MSEARTLIHRWLPPLVVLAGLSAILLSARESGGRTRQRQEELLLARVLEPSSRVAAGPEVDAYLARYGKDPDARWLAVDLHARRLDVAAALRAFDGDAGVRDAPGAARRFAATLLRRLGDRAPDGPAPSWLFPHALLARLDSGDPDAAETLGRIAAKITTQELVNFYTSAHRAATRGSKAMATAWMARASDPVFRTAGSTILARPGTTDLADGLRPLVESPWRTERPLLWTYATRALGTIGDPASLDALRRERAAATGDGKDEHRRRLSCDVGLAASGDAEARATVLRALDDPADDWAGVQLALALFARLWGGDAAAGPVIADLAARETAVTTRLQIGMCAVVSDEVPAGLPVERWVAELSRSPMLTARALAHVWALRNGRPEAAASLLAALREAVAGHDVVVETQGPDDDRGAAVVEILRALARWG